MKKYDYLIVGSGLFGATFAYRAKKAGKKCLVIDRRPHLGGNVYCKPIDGVTGEPLETFGTFEPLKPSETMHPVIQVHQYGAHIFHTNNKEVWDFVNSIVPFNRYTNCPVANYKGELYNLPFNMNTFNRMWPDVHTPAEAQAKLEEQRKDAVEEINKHHREIGAPELKASPTGGGFEGALNLEEQALSLVGEEIYTKLIKDYTEKQWGRPCKDLPAFIIKRLPLRFTFDNNYFNDKYQGIPIGGYNVLIQGLLCPPQSPTSRSLSPALPSREGEKSPSTGWVGEASEGRIDTLVGISVPLNAPTRGVNATVLEGGPNKAAYREKADIINYGLLKANSKQMRKEPTEAESAFWELVRGKQLGCKFRRQHAIGEYIVDFICLEKNLIVELDGGYHFTEEQQIEDTYRTKILNEFGYTVLRLKNEEVLGAPEATLEKVQLAMSLSENLPQLGGLRGAFHDNSSLLLGGLRGARLVYTGPLDEYFDSRLGKLDWRTVTFKNRIEDTPNYQGNAVVNYTSHDVPYTRVIEHKHFEMFGQEVYDCPKTVISEEYPCEYDPDGASLPTGEGRGGASTGGGLVGAEPYYPVNNERNNALVAKYKELAHSEGIVFPEDLNGFSTGETHGRGLEGKRGALFGGRLAEYKYYDMAPIIEKVLKIEI